MGFGPLDCDESNMKDDMHDENYPMHPSTLKFLKLHLTPSSFPKLRNTPYYPQTHSDHPEIYRNYS